MKKKSKWREYNSPILWNDCVVFSLSIRVWPILFGRAAIPDGLRIARCAWGEARADGIFGSVGKIQIVLNCGCNGNQISLVQKCASNLSSHQLSQSSERARARVFIRSYSISIKYLFCCFIYLFSRSIPNAQPR